MYVLIDRKWKKEDYTIGNLFIDGEFFSNTLEDKDRGLRQDMSTGELSRLKVYGKTAIPTGHYKIVLTWSTKYRRIMPQIMNVKAFTGIRVHSGNQASDSLGCVLLGKNDKKGWISNSRITCEEFEKRLIAAGGECDLDIM